MDNSLPVYILTVPQRSSKVDTISAAFQHAAFTVQQQPQSQPYENLSHKIGEIAATEAQHILDALLSAHTNFKDKPCIIVKDNSTTHVTPEQMANYVTFALTSHPEADLIYLSKSNDRCQLYTQKTQLPDSSSFIARTHAPHGFQAVILTPTGRDKLLGKEPIPHKGFFKLERPLSDQVTHEISIGNLVAYCVTPNIIDFDIRSALSNSDFGKLNECQPIQPPQQNVGSSTAAYVWFFIVILAIFLLAWALIRIGPGN